MRSGSKLRRAAACAGVALSIDVTQRLIRSYLREDPTQGEPLDLAPGRDVIVEADDGAQLHAWLSDPDRSDDIDRRRPVALLVHGLATDRRMWSTTARLLLDRGFSTIVYDQRGHGESTLGSERFSAERLGDDLRCVIETLDLRDVVVVGHSAGGIVVESLLVHSDDRLIARLKACVLCSTGSTQRKLSSAVEAVIASFTGSSMLERIVSVRGVGRVLFTGFAGPIQPAAHVSAALEGYKKSSGPVRVAMLRVTQSDYGDLLKRVKLPVTVVIGDNDRYVPPWRARDLVSQIPGAKLVEVPGVAHMVPFEAPEKLADVIEEALELERPLRRVETTNSK
ncbi:MAG: alpha/beta fold hydrolase [Acidimicrobiales bacterium]